MAMLDIPHSTSGQRSGNSSNPVQVFNLMELVEGQQYEVKIRAVTAVGPGPNSTEIVGIPAPRKSNIIFALFLVRMCVEYMCVGHPISLSLSPPCLPLPFSLFLASATARSYQPLNFLQTQNAVIGVGAALCGALLIAILVLAIGLLVYLIRQRRVKMGKHETLMEEEEFDKRQRRREKRRKV